MNDVVRRLKNTFTVSESGSKPKQCMPHVGVAKSVVVTMRQR